MKLETEVFKFARKWLYSLFSYSLREMLNTRQFIKQDKVKRKLLNLYLDYWLSVWLEENNVLQLQVEFWQKADEHKQNKYKSDENQFVISMN